MHDFFWRAIDWPRIFLKCHTQGLDSRKYLLRSPLSPLALLLIFGSISCADDFFSLMAHPPPPPPKKYWPFPYDVDRLTNYAFCLTNTQPTKPARVNGPFVIVMERRPLALPNMSGTKSTTTTHHPNARRKAANQKRKEKHMNDYVRCSPKSQSVSKVMIIIKSSLRS